VGTVGFIAAIIFVLLGVYHFWLSDVLTGAILVPLGMVMFVVAAKKPSWFNQIRVF